jgi:glycosyltransferase involved in cell wall biosynthesis
MNNHKKIDVVTKYFYPITAGIETNTLETYSILAQNGWDVTIHTSKDLYLEKNALPDYEEVRGIKVKRYPFNKLGYTPDIDWQNTDAVCLHNFDIFPHVRIMFYVLWLKITNRKNFGFFLTPHGGFNPVWSIFPKIQAIIKSTYHFTLGTILINLTTDGVRAVSEWEKEEMLKKFVRKDLIRVISNGIEDEAFFDLEQLASDEMKEKVKGLGKYIIQVGRIYPIKNYETTIRALKLADPELKYVIAGPLADKAYEKSLENLIQDLGLVGRVIFMGVVRGVDKFYLIKHAQMMVHMAIWESFCNVVHEGMSQGLVCVVADNTALPYLIKDGINGWCVETHDPVALAQKIDYVMQNLNTDLIQQIQKNNKKFGLQHSWRNVAFAMGDFYSEKLNSIRQVAYAR